MKYNQTSHLVKPLLIGGLFLGSALAVQANLFDYTQGHGHFGLNYNVDPPDPRDRRDSTSLYATLNPGGGLFPHVAALDNPPNNLFTNVAPGPYGPDQVTHIVPNTTFQSRAASGDLNKALGNSGGDFMWILPADSTTAANQGAPWTGFSVNPTALGIFDGDSVDVSLTTVNGPGEVALWVNDSFGNPEVWMGSADGFSSDKRTLDASHPKHNFMGFTAPGDYDVTFKWETSVSGSPISESATFGFTVVPEPASYGLLAGVFATAFLLRRPTRK
jgi:hypothetical protein